MSPLPVDTGTAGEHCTNTTLPPEHVGIPCQVSSGGRDHQFSPRAHLPNQSLHADWSATSRVQGNPVCTRHWYSLMWSLVWQAGVLFGHI